ncbi:MAG: molybdate ABC transporter substrate-binding protein [Acidimicrobiia bacterium]|nr:molybdate ABC transporter substrate-binding protein [Acidimicrobiia bacterium]
MPALSAAMLLVVSCSSGQHDQVIVSAAASLTVPFMALEAEFEAAHPGTDLVLNLAGSPVLRDQILEGAAVDVFASAAPVHVAAIVDAGMAGSSPVPFAFNQMQLAVPAGNPGGVRGVEDLGRDDLLVGLCASGVPCGDLAEEILARAGVVAAPDTREADIRALLTKLKAGELDVALVYSSDVVTSGEALDSIPLPAGVGGETVYQIVQVAGADPLAAEFIGLVLSDRGRAVLAESGFGLP